MSDLLKAFDAGREKFEETFASQRFEDFANFYTTDCRFMPPGQPLAEGREALIAAVKQIWDSGIRKVKLKIEEAVDLGNGWAYTRGFVTFLLEDDTVAIPGKYFVLWKRVDGRWKLFTDIFNRISPA